MTWSIDSCLPESTPVYGCNTTTLPLRQDWSDTAGITGPTLPLKLDYGLRMVDCSNRPG